VQVDVLLMV